jgi:hypothetical protein
VYPGDDGLYPGDDGVYPGDDGVYPGDDGVYPGDDDGCGAVSGAIGPDCGSICSIGDVGYDDGVVLHRGNVVAGSTKTVSVSARGGGVATQARRLRVVRITVSDMFTIF